MRLPIIYNLDKGLSNGTTSSIKGILTSANLISASFLGVFCLTCDRLAQTAACRRNRVFAALLDNFTHGIIGSWTWAVVLGGNLNSTKNLRQIILAGILASCMDVDHFLAARSIHLKDATSLQQRPLFHMTTLIPVIAIISEIIICASGLHRLHYFPYLFTLSWFSHHIRDATRRGLWLWPFGSTPPVPYGMYIGLTLVLPFLIAILMSITGSPIHAVELHRVLHRVGGIQQV
ncbi:transmembrane protein 267-like [Anneissia japonica]|uniref:transmembrane protein 267-like n=1 Tax=Anneissia japonica TaxID=1529436 RepID=UPI0014255E17|nr:transmembrane protein 267-like [Anneissia japonica]XP_033100890.1 transmembrane protein 267-like [Anneissia japonica]XP_033100891.1 transmembrane protein 267-like [Anneissia japonica]XP_033100892.1 transmembrane protein 267-like [Anneissia japonica]